MSLVGARVRTRRGIRFSSFHSFQQIITFESKATRWKNGSMKLRSSYVSGALLVQDLFLSCRCRLNVIARRAMLCQNRRN